MLAGTPAKAVALAHETTNGATARIGRGAESKSGVSCLLARMCPLERTSSMPPLALVSPSPSLGLRVMILRARVLRHLPRCAGRSLTLGVSGGGDLGWHRQPRAIARRVRGGPGMV
jgi:hypothetical protein